MTCIYNLKFKPSVEILDKYGNPVHVDFNEIDVNKIMWKMRREVK